MVTAYDLYNNIDTAYTGTVTLSSTDSNFGSSSYTLTSQSNGASIFSVTLKNGGNQTITAVGQNPLNAKATLNGTSQPISIRGLLVTSFTPTPTGFTATFNKPIVPGDVYLYNSNLTTKADVLMVATSDVVAFKGLSGTVKFIYNGHQASPATFDFDSSVTPAAFQSYLQSIPGLTAAAALLSYRGPMAGLLRSILAKE